ncbi:hypothetical protein LCGC14_0979150 [marine sediment metagenome]|uniref:Uncharacterized protein n=1 Tax=marine sediment metagenome TaxID=412755 RepID=A0A0F9N9A9_9ZZZZ
MDSFGSPKLTDTSGRYDRILDNAQKRVEEVKKNLNVIPNRPVGSVKLSPEEEKRDYMAISFDAAALDDRLSQFIAELGFGPGMLEFAAWVKRNNA